MTLFFALSVALAGEPGWTTATTESMATLIQVVLPADRVAAAEDVFAVFAAVESTANEWKPDAELGRVNAAAGGEAVAVGTDLCALLRRGLEAGDLTDGAFDVTWASLWGVWDFRAATPAVPDAELIRGAKRVVADVKFEVSMLMSRLDAEIGGLSQLLADIRGMLSESTQRATVVWPFAMDQKPSAP